MAIVYGKIESLKRIRSILSQNGIHRFNSTKDLERFLKNFDSEKEELFFNIENEFELELDVLQVKSHQLTEQFELRKQTLESNLIKQIEKLRLKCEDLSGPAKSAVLEVTNWYQFIVLKSVIFILEKNLKTIIKLRTRSLGKELKKALKKSQNFSFNRQSIISNRYSPKIHELERIKRVVSDLDTLIAGAVGESLVENELKKLPDSCIFFNDYSIQFQKPLFNPQTKGFIRSVQIDHLLITEAGVFILETKNWSKKSIANLDLRSPVEQILRTSYALYKILNEQNVLNKHHWGAKKIPIWNIIAMINNKPKQKFQFVAIKKLSELNQYINHFEPVFVDEEVSRIVERLKKFQRH